jgi:hypothetical protein
MKRRFAQIALAVGLALPAVASAQAPVSGSLKYNGDVSANGTVAGAAVGPYSADLKTYGSYFADLNNVMIWCVDWSHVAPATSVWDSYYATAFTGNGLGRTGDGDFSNTRAYAGLGGTSAQRNAGAEDLYRRAAWLIEQYDPTKDGMVGANLFNARNIQGSIWGLFGASIAQGDLTYYGLNVASNVSLNRDWFVLSDNVECTMMYQGYCYGRESSNQEFMTSFEPAQVFEIPTDVTTAPEPSTYALLGAGLLAMGVVARRRRRQTA